MRADDNGYAVPAERATSAGCDKIRAMIRTLDAAIVHAFGTVDETPTVHEYAPGIRGKIARWLDAHADCDWRKVFRFHSTMVAIFWAAVSGLYIALPAFQSWLRPIPFAILCMLFPVALLIARLTKQTGLDKDG